jgi:hypothetical protein
MNKQISALLIVTALFFASSAGIMFDSQDAKVRIREASSIFLSSSDPSITKARILSALVEFLDVTASLARESQYNTEIKYRIDVAKDLFQKESIFDDKARQYLSFAYRMLTNGKKYERPKELDEFVTPAEAQEKARKYAVELVDKALARLEDGNELETAKLLLELVLMIVTPISG